MAPLFSATLLFCNSLPVVGVATSIVPSEARSLLGLESGFVWLLWAQFHVR